MALVDVVGRTPQARDHGNRLRIEVRPLVRPLGADSIRGDEFERAYAEAGRSLAASSHCLAYEVARGVEDPESYMVRIEWDSVEGHEQGFRQSPEFREFFSAVKPFFDDSRRCAITNRCSAGLRMPAFRLRPARSEEPICPEQSMS